MRSHVFRACGRVTAISLATCATLAITSPVQAQDNNNANDALNVLIEEVVVTARRREETAQSVPIPISALSEEQLEARGIQDIKDIERITPNLSFNESGVNRGASIIFLRGIGQVNWGPTQDPKVGTYVDGVYIGRPQGGIFDLLDVERVEVLRGPQGTLFGRNTTAGLVQVITKKPHDEFEATIQGGFGNDGQITTGGYINMPLGENLAGRVAFNTRKADGWMTDNIGREWNSTNRQAVRASLLWTPSETFDLQLNADAYRARETSGLANCTFEGPEDGSQSAGLAFLAYVLGRYDELRAACTDSDNNVFTSNDNDPNDNDVDVRSFSAIANWDLEWATFTSVTSWRDTEEINDSWGWGTDFAGDVSNLLEVIAPAQSEYDQVSQEFRLSGNSFNDKLDWTAGVYWFTEDAMQPGGVPLYRDAPIPTPEESPIFHAVPALAQAALGTQIFGSRNQNLIATNSSWAAFVEGTYHVTEKLHVTAGIRYTRDDREFTRVQTLADGSFDPGNVCPGNPVDPATGFVTSDRCFMETDFSKSTPRIIVSYNVSDDFLIYGSASRGYSSGGFNGDIQMQPYSPETSDNYEAGFKGTWWDRRLRLNATVFLNDYKNQQITVSRNFNNQPTAAVINAQEATLNGLELEAIILPWEGWAFTAAFGYLGGEYDEFVIQDQETDPVTGVTTFIDRDLKETEFVRGSPTTLSLSATYSYPLSQGGSIIANVGWSYRGRQFNTLETAQSSLQPSYDLVDARIAWNLANDKTSIALWGTNLNNEEYYFGAVDLSVGGLPSGTVSKYYAPPRRFGIELRHDFN
ncbi:MAG: TonB-dependent receptor [Pseudomonadota bacterium]